MIRFMTEFHPNTIQGIARHTRKMLGSVKSRPKNHLELAYALAAAKIVVATLESACQEVGIPEPVMDACNEMAADAEFGPLIIKAPQVLRVDAFEDSGIAIKILGDTEPIRQWEVMGELRKRLKKAFDEEGIEIPFPHVVLVTRGAKATDVGEVGEGG